MKRAGFVFIAVAILFGAGCVSSGKNLVAQKDPIALVSVVCNEEISWTGEQITSPDTAGPLSKRRMRSNPDMTITTKAFDIINPVEKIFRDSMGSSKHFNLADKETVFQSRAYQNSNERMYPNRKMITADDYRFIYYRDKNFPAALAAETGIQRTMFVEFNISKTLYTGISFFGNCRAEVEMTVIVMNAQGKTVYAKTISVMSTTSTRTINGVYSQSEFVGMVINAIDGICFEFFNNFN